MIRYAETLQKLPANLTKLFPALTIEEVIAKAPRPMNTRTFNKNVERFSSLLKWAMSGPKKYGLDRNPAVGLARDERKDAVRRLPFTPEELKALFAGPEFSKRAFQNCYAYWLMPLALYTGARLGELTQLYVTDIVEFEGVACLSISDEEEGRRIKTRNSRRLVPIHSKLEELGFLRYVEGLRSAGIARVFPELRPGRDGFGQVASKWFKRYRQRCGTNRRPQPSTTAGTPAASPLPFFLVPRGSAGYDGGRTGNVLILRYPVAARRDGPVVRRPRLGGLLNFYERPAA
jgi:integrase